MAAEQKQPTLTIIIASTLAAVITVVLSVASQIYFSGYGEGVDDVSLQKIETGVTSLTRAFRNFDDRLRSIEITFAGLNATVELNDRRLDRLENGINSIHRGKPNDKQND